MIEYAPRRPAGHVRGIRVPPAASGTFEELGSPYSVVKIVPFSHDLEGVSGAWPESGVPVMAWGMTTVEEVAKRLGWKPGVFKNANFDMRVLHQNYGGAMLNSDAEFHRLGEVPGFEGARFIRPVHDTKSFTGPPDQRRRVRGVAEAALRVEAGVHDARPRHRGAGRQPEAGQRRG